MQLARFGRCRWDARKERQRGEEKKKNGTNRGGVRWSMCCLHVPVPTFVETRLCNRPLSRLIIPVISNLYRHDSASADENSREGSGIIIDGWCFVPLRRNFYSIKICSWFQGSLLKNVVKQFNWIIDHFINLQFLFKGIRNI